MKKELTIIAAELLIRFALLCASAFGEYRTDNFVVNAQSQSFEKKVAQRAEESRKKLATIWLGEEMPKWYRPCIVTVRDGKNLGAGGSTHFNFDQGQVFGWRMTVQGSRQEILETVVPHEVSHTVFASHFRRPLPRWADEGAATLAEAPDVQRDLMQSAQQMLARGRPIPFTRMLEAMEYPNRMDEVMRLYSQGYSFTAHLVSMKGRREYIKFLDTAHKSGWDKAVTVHYGYRGVHSARDDWQSWLQRQDCSASTSLRKVRRNRKPILEIWKASWCGPCNLFDRYMEQDREFHQTLHFHFQVRERNYNRSYMEATLKGVTRLPTFVTRSSRVVGFTGPDDLLQRLGVSRVKPYTRTIPKTDVPENTKPSEPTDEPQESQGGSDGQPAAPAPTREPSEPPAGPRDDTPRPTDPQYKRAGSSGGSSDESLFDRILAAAKLAGPLLSSLAGLGLAGATGGGAYGIWKIGAALGRRLISNAINDDRRRTNRGEWEAPHIPFRQDPDPDPLPIPEPTPEPRPSPSPPPEPEPVPPSQPKPSDKNTDCTTTGHAVKSGSLYGGIKFVPVENDQFYRAYRWAMEKAPGLEDTDVGTLERLQSLIQQYLAGDVINA